MYIYLWTREKTAGRLVATDVQLASTLQGGEESVRGRLEGLVKLASLRGISEV